MTTPAVDTVEQIDAQWLTAGLRDGGIDATVRSVASEPVGTGQMGSCFRLRIALVPHQPTGLTGFPDGHPGDSAS
jgi:hypothetical protein